jgi:hypothetical protein
MDGVAVAKMPPNEMVVWILAGIGVAAILYVINQNTDGGAPIPLVEGEAQFAGLNVSAGAGLNAGTMLDMRHEIHGWHPGYDPGDQVQPVTRPRVGYPTVPGGNISHILHNGWSSVTTNSPNGTNDWITTPPEAAIL